MQIIYDYPKKVNYDNLVKSFPAGFNQAHLIAKSVHDEGCL